VLYTFTYDHRDGEDVLVGDSTTITVTETPPPLFVPGAFTMFAEAGGIVIGTGRR
jgi:hypothetical protein